MAREGLGDLFANIGCGMWSVTPYGLCDYRCVYCCTGVQGTSKPLMTKRETVAEVRRRLRDLPEPRFLILGAFSDSYPSVEAEHGITRAIVEELVAAEEPFTIVTKAEIVLRDLDLFVANGNRCQIQVSVSSTDDDILRRLDPGAPTAAARLRVLAELHRAGLRVGLNALPWIPDVSDTEALIERVPSDVEIIFSPLAFGAGRESMRLLGRVYSRDEVWRRYMAEYERFGHIANTSWVRPALPPRENYPMHRLRRRTAPTSAPGAPVG